MITKLSKWAILMLALIFAAGCLDSDDDDDDDGIGDLGQAQEPAELGTSDDVAEVAAGLDDLDAGGFAGTTDPGGELPSQMDVQGMLETGAITAAQPLMDDHDRDDEVCMEGSFEETEVEPGVTEASYDNCMVFFFTLNGDIRIAEEGDNAERITYGDGDTPFTMSLEDFEEDSDDSFTISFLGEMFTQDPVPAGDAPENWGSTAYTNLDYEFDYDVEADGESFWIRSFTDDLDIYEDDNYTRIDGKYGMDSSVDCGAGSVEVETLEDLYQPMGAPGWVDGTVEFSNELGQTATVEFLQDEEVRITTDDGEQETLNLTEFSAICEFEEEDDF